MDRLPASIRFHLVAAPLALHVAALGLLFVGEGRPGREVADIWLPLITLVLVVSAVLFAVLWFAYRTRSAAVRGAALTVLLSFVGFALPTVVTVDDALIWLPVAIQGVLCAVYSVTLVVRMELGDAPRAGVCPACGYDLRGSPGPTCPECGAERVGNSAR